MSAIWKILQGFWKITENNDNKNHATQTEPEGVVRVCNIPYNNDGNHYHLLDVYYPEETTENLPVIIDIHGGGWMYADKDLNKFYNLELAARGYCVYSISYRLCPDVTVNEQIQDCMSALEWIGNNIFDYPADPANIMLTGDSAGGQLAAYCACLLQSDELRRIFATATPEIKLKCITLTSPVAYMNTASPMGAYTKLMWGNYKSKQTAEYMNLDKLLPYSMSLPPVLLITSSGDFLAEEQTNLAFYDLRKRHIPCKLVDYPKFDGKNLPHVFAVLKPASVQGKNCIDVMLSFFKKTMFIK